MHAAPEAAAGRPRAPPMLSCELGGRGVRPRPRARLRLGRRVCGQKFRVRLLSLVCSYSHWTRSLAPLPRRMSTPTAGMLTPTEYILERLLRDRLENDDSESDDELPEYDYAQ